MKSSRPGGFCKSPDDIIQSSIGLRKRCQNHRKHRGAEVMEMEKVEMKTAAEIPVVQVVEMEIQLEETPEGIILVEILPEGIQQMERK